MPLDIANVTTTHFATLVFAHLLASSPQTKAIARSIKPCLPALSAQGETFVPADGVPDAAPPAEDEDVPQSILQQLTENLSLCFISRSHVEDGDERQGREWDRLIVGYLSLLIQWLWEDPKAVAEFLDGGGLGVVSPSLFRTRWQIPKDVIHSIIAVDPAAGRTHQPDYQDRGPHPWPVRTSSRGVLRVQPRTGRDHAVSVVIAASISHLPLCCMTQTRRHRLMSVF